MRQLILQSNACVATTTRATKARMLVRLKHPTFALVCRTRHVHYKRGKDSNSGKTYASDHVSHTAANRSGLDSTGRPPPAATTRSRPLPPNYKSAERRLL